MTGNFQKESSPPRDAEASRGGSVTISTLERIARGDRAAVGDCLDRHGSLVWSLALRFCPNRADAEDLVQDVFIELWKNAGRFDPALASETTFVAMITRRRIIDRRRKLMTQPAPDSLPEGLSAAPAPKILERADDVAKAYKALDSLREEQRLVLSLSLRDGLTYDQIAKTVGLPLGTVKTHARRGLMRLRELLQGSLRTESASAEAGSRESNR